MEIIGTDSQKRRELQTGTRHACRILCDVVIPVCKELKFEIEITDTAKLDRYLRSLSALKWDYVAKMKEGTGNPALASVLEKSAEEMWENAMKKHPLLNPYIINEIPSGIFECLTITGRNLVEFNASPNQEAIDKACAIYGAQEDIDKREEIKALCDALNECFNGMGGLFFGYVCVQGGKFYPIANVTNYRPLIEGGY